MATFDENGYKIDQYTDIQTYMQDEFKSNLGNDLDFGSDSIIGNVVNITSQIAYDFQNNIHSLISNLDPDSAVGIWLDYIVSLSGITPRQTGTFTLQNIDVTTDRDVSLTGLDSDISNINGTGFTVSDNNGNQFILANSVSLNAGTTSLSFRAKTIGATTTVANTITNIDTITLGVTAVNNSETASSVGVKEEYDPDLRNRRDSSLDIRATDSSTGLKGDLLSVSGVTEAIVFENDTTVTDSNGQIRNSIWCVVEGGSDQDVVDKIFIRKTATVPTYCAGISTSVSKTATGSSRIINFDRPVSKTLHLQFDIKKTTSTATFDETVIKTYIINNKTYSISESADSTSLLELANTTVLAQGGGKALNARISTDGVTYYDYLEVDYLYEKWNLSNTNIIINIL